MARGRKTKFDSIEALREHEREYAKKYHDSFESYWNSWYDGVKYDFDERNMDVEHSERLINGEKVHALSVYGYES